MAPAATRMERGPKSPLSNRQRRMYRPDQQGSNNYGPTGSSNALGTALGNPGRRPASTMDAPGRTADAGILSQQTSWMGQHVPRPTSVDVGGT